MMFIAPVRKPALLDIVFFTIASPAVLSVYVRSLYTNIQDGADWAGKQLSNGYNWVDEQVNKGISWVGEQVNNIGDAFSSGLDSINPFS